MLAITIEIVIIVALVLFNGALAMSELAVVSARKARLQSRAEGGDAGARMALRLATEPNRFLSTVQIGITMVGILAGAFGGATLAETVSERLTALGLGRGISATLGVTVVVLGITYLSVIIGELVPKRLALQNPEQIAARVARPMRVLSTVAAPLVAVLTLSTDLIMRLLRIPPRDDAVATEDEIRLLIQQSTRAGIFEAAEEEMVSGVFRLADRRAAGLMTPRPDVMWIDLDDPIDVIWREMSSTPHSQFPVCRGDLDTVLGIIAIRDLWSQMVTGAAVDLEQLLRPPLFVPESMPMLRVLGMFKQTGVHLALVIDEFGGVEGLLTLNDVLEAIVGDLPSANEIDTPRAVRREDGSWLVDGLLPVDELKDLLELKALPGEDGYQTLAGFVLLQAGRIPAPAEAFVWQTYRFEVMDMDGNRIDKVLVSALSGDHAAAERLSTTGGQADTSP